MIKKAAILFLLSLSVTSTWAQFSFGLQAGVNTGGPLGMIDGKGTPIPGPLAGLDIGYRISPKFSFSALVLYSLRAANYEQSLRGDSTVFVTVGGQQFPVETQYTNNVKGKLRLHYVDVPILARYYITQRSSIDFGLQLSYLFAGSDKGTNDVVFVENGVFNQRVDFNNFNELSRFDYGVSLGGTYYTKYGLSIALRASRGFVALYKKGFFTARGVAETSLYNTYAHFTLGYTFKQRNAN